MSRRKKNAKELAAIESRRLIQCVNAYDDLLTYCKLQHPHIEHPDDPNFTKFEVMPHHEMIAEKLTDVINGDTLRLIIEMPPRMGKSEMVGFQTIPWAWGRNPWWQIIYGTYNSDFAKDQGKIIKGRLMSEAHGQVFPGFELRKDSKAADSMMTTGGGVLSLRGREAAATGKGGDLIVIDDPIKDDLEATSVRVRNDIWNWYNKVMYTRLMPGGRIIIIHTRWHEDDLIGRLTDPTNEHYRAKEAAKWEVLKLPALLDNPKTGEKESLPLWPNRYSKEHLLGIKELDPKTFYSLYQQEPSPDEGDFFKRDWIKLYDAEELPKNLRTYTASDHAVGTGQRNDSTVLLTVGVDEDDNIWVLDCWWEKKETDAVVEAMLIEMRRWKPIYWWAEKGHISKSIGPFLRKRMNETRTYTAVHEVTPVHDKVTRARSIQGRMSMGKVFFPRFAHWWGAAENEILKFPNATHDDFVDALAHVGNGLDLQVSAAPQKEEKVVPITGTMGWIKKQAEFEEKQKRAAGGMW